MQRYGLLAQALRDGHRQRGGGQVVFNGSDDASGQRRPRRWQDRGRTIMVGALVALLVLDAVLLAMGSSAAGISAQLAPAPGLRSGLHRGLALAALAVAIVAVVLIVRDKEFRAVSQGLKRHDHKRLLKQVRGGLPYVPTELPLVRDFARSLAGRSYALLTPLVFALICLGQALDGPNDIDPWVTVLSGCSLVLFAVFVVLMARQMRDARRFLDRHPEPQP